MSEEEIMEIIRSRLRLDVTTSVEYMGDRASCGALYRDVATVRLLLYGEVISEVSI